MSRIFLSFETSELEPIAPVETAPHTAEPRVIEGFSDIEAVDVLGLGLVAVSALFLTFLTRANIAAKNQEEPQQTAPSR